MDQTSEQPVRQTILIANMDLLMSESIHDILAAHFDILSATTGEDALAQSEKSKEPIALLVSAFELPDMTGIELGVKITAKQHKIEVLLTQPFKGGVLVLNEGWHFLPSPFFESQLSTLIVGLIQAPTSKFLAVAQGGRKQTWN